VVVPDLRGFGQSRSEDAFTIDSLAGDIIQLIEHLGGPAVVGGLSMGGYVAMAIARKRPDLLRGLMLMDTRAEADSSQARENRQKMIDLVRLQGCKAVADQMLPKLLAPGAPEGRPDLARQVRAMAEACPPRTIENALVALRDRPDRSADLPSIAVPTLIVVGEQDQITPPDVSEAMHRAIPNSKLVKVPGAGHMAPLEQPEPVNRAVREFLSSL
jgi:3-oxoadipate enol-lactonase